jgi:hypothetical protein
MSVKYEVTGYDRETGRLIDFYDIPEQDIVNIKSLAGIPPSDDGLGSYPLNRGQLSEIARSIKTSIEAGDRNYFLEAYDESGDRQIRK